MRFVYFMLTLLIMAVTCVAFGCTYTAQSKAAADTAVGFGTLMPVTLLILLLCVLAILRNRSRGSLSL